MLERKPVLTVFTLNENSCKLAVDFIMIVW